MSADADNPIDAAQAAFTEGRFADALAHVEEALRRDPDSAENRVHLASVYYALDRLDDCRATLDALGDRADGVAESHHWRGMLHYRAGAYEPAVAAFDRALTVAPWPEALHWRGVSHHKLGDDEAALEDVEAAVALAPGILQWRVNRVGLLSCLERYDDVLDAIDALPPDGQAATWTQRVVALYNLCQYDDALDALDRAEAALSGSTAWMHARRAECWYYLGEYEDAVESATRALALESGNGRATEIRAWANQALARDADALADYRRTAELWPDYATVRLHWADYLADLGRDAEALELLDRVVEMRPDWASARWSRCAAHDRLGRPDLADADALEARRLESLESGGDTAVTAPSVVPRVQAHFRAAPLEQLEMTERYFPGRSFGDMCLALEGAAEAGFGPVELLAPQYGHGQVVQTLPPLLTLDRRNPITAGSPKYIDFDTGEDTPLRCQTNGIWLLESAGVPLAYLMYPYSGQVYAQAAAPRTEEGARAVAALFEHVARAVERSACYRGKVLSFDTDAAYHGRAVALQVHRLRRVAREHVILPRRTLDLLDRNALDFARRRDALRARGMGTKKGLLFHGPPGTGKTHTVHYLAAALPGHTTILLTAEQLGNLAEAMTLARLLQPALVVIEDVDLIARDRSKSGGPWQESMLNRLLNEMDGLRADADVMFVLTTNRPETLEPALAARPGRIDQAIEFPYPDDEGRDKLVRLYAHGFGLAAGLTEEVVRRTQGVSAAFLKELMRRAAQFALERDADDLTVVDAERALDELLVAGGPLTRALLGTADAG